MSMVTRKRVALPGRKCLVMAIAFMGGVLALGSAQASDTEVYSRSVTVSGASAPILMMVLDTSDNMLNCMTSSSSCAGLSTSRVATLGRVMNTALFGNHDSSAGAAIIKPAPGYLHMGYTRFLPGNNGGGWVRYPADKTLDTRIDVPSNLSSGTVTVKVPAAVADASAPVTAGVIGATTTTTSTFSIGNSTTSPVVGVVFSNVLVPMGATINSATLNFTETATGTPLLSVASEQSDDASQDFSASGLAARSYYSDSAATYTSGSINVSSQVSAVVSRSGWCGGNALSLRITSTGVDTIQKIKGVDTTVPPATATVDSFEGAGTTSASIPTLTISYTLPTANLSNTCTRVPIDTVSTVTDILDDAEWAESGASSVIYADPGLNPAAISAAGIRNIVGVRFSSVAVKPGSKVLEAWLYSTGFSNGATGVASTIAVDAFNQDNLASFCTRSSSNVVSCTVPGGSPTSQLTTFSLPASTTDTTNYVVNVQPQVSAVLGRAGWANNNALGFRLYNSSTTVTSSPVALSSVDGGASKTMVLHIKSLRPVTDLTSITKTVRQDLAEDLTTFLASSVGGMASLANTYAETAHYMLGQAVNTTDSPTVGGVTYTQPDPRTVITGSSPLTYKTPVGSASDCSANYIYMMSDGVPNDASGVQANSAGALVGSNLSCNTYKSTVKSGGNNQLNFSCMMAVAEALSTSANTLGKPVHTNTVLFGPSPPDASLKADLNSIANDHGAGKYYEATDETTLLNSLLDTLKVLVDESGSITAPGVAVNQFNRLTNLDQLYYAVFDPETLHARWLGNVKRYRLAFFGDPAIPSTLLAKIVDANCALTATSCPSATDPNTGLFSTASQSFWSPSVDGNKVILGGVASKLPAPASRTIYTNVTSATALENLNSVSAATAATALGFSSSNQFTNLRNWMLGYNINIVDRSAAPAKISSTLVTPDVTKLRQQIGGVLHSQPVVVNYGTLNSATQAQALADPELQDNEIFFSDMEGMLHAIQATKTSGVEDFSIIPIELLKRTSTLVIDDLQDLPEFGLDLTPTIYRLDANNDQKIVAGSSGDKLYVFSGMRMGGSNYYAFDVTNRSAPALKWQITGGTTPNFTNIGQTWSKPVLGKVKVNGVTTDVIFVAGGYDPKHETAGYASPTNDSDAKGNQVYILTLDGTLLWWASNTASASLNVPAMTFSIPAELKTLDSNNDGLVDAVYFGDLGGQVFRLDIDNGNTAASSLGKRVQLLASIGQTVTADTTNQRRFYEPPSVAQVLDSTGKAYVAVAMGSGYRSHPLDVGTQDAFYAFRDDDALRADLLTTSSLQATITPTDLATVNLATTAGVSTVGKKGWQLILPDTGEKVLTTPIILFGEVIFASFVPDLSTATSCAPGIGKTKEWRVSISDAAASFDLNNDGAVTALDRAVDSVKGLGGSPELIVLGGGKNAIITGTGVSRNKDFKTAAPVRIRWYEKTKK